MRKFTLTLLGLAAAFGAQAQREIGMATSNWSSTNGLYLNPANIADSRQKFTIDLFSLNIGFDNNLGQVNTSKIIKGDSLKLGDIFKPGNSAQFNMMAPFAEFRGPGFMWSINHKNSVALTTRVRAFNQLGNFDRTLYNTLTSAASSAINGTFDPNQDYALTSKNFRFTANVWSEIGLSYARVLIEKKEHMLKAGVTGRFIMGAVYANVQGNNLDAEYNHTTQTLAVNQSDVEYSSNINNQNKINGTSDLIKNFFNSNAVGFGGDVGVVYEWRPGYPKDYSYEMDGTQHIDRSQNAYRLRISAAVTDIGSMNYNKTNSNFLFSGNGTIDPDKVGDALKNGTLPTFLSDNGFDTSSNKKNTKMSLPTAMVIGADVNIYKRLYANITYIGNMVSSTSIANHYYSQLTVTPRYDSRVFSIGVPVTYSMMTKAVKVGASLRIAGFFIGSDDALAALSDNQYGFNFYFGAFVPFNKTLKMHDRDHDHVSNKLDLCPTIPGTYTAKGCPDKDLDSVTDNIDRCPDVAGPVYLKGCPDRDHDSIPDIDDRCPDVAGPAAFKGCPDTDGDGIPDIDDRCPDVAGKAELKGCPDADGDGVPDIDDKCPNQAGTAAFQGCPDTDGDGIPDNEDRCPTQVGSAANHGCPEVSIEVKKRLAFAATAIEFQTGKAIIKPKSYPLLDEIVKILVEYKDYYMTIDGYTDNVGKAEKNVVLSRQRAESVKAYFVSKGIVDQRIVTNGHGMENPVASNKTAAGRSKNRRVDMDLKLKQ